MPAYRVVDLRMAEFAPLRTGQLVVRFRTPARRKLLWMGAILSALLILFGLYEFGRYRGGFDHLAAVVLQRQSDSLLKTVREQNDALRAQAASAELARRVDHQAYADIEKTLGELQAQVARQREELAFYRGIVAPEDGLGGLHIQRLEVLPGSADRQFHLRLVLVQSLRQEAVATGNVEITLVGSRDNMPVRLTINELGSADVHPAFSFRYFQNVEQDIVLPEWFEPASVEVEVKPARQNAIKQSFPWQVQAPE